MEENNNNDDNNMDEVQESFKGAKALAKTNKTRRMETRPQNREGFWDARTPPTVRALFLSLSRSIEKTKQGEKGSRENEN